MKYALQKITMSLGGLLLAASVHAEVHYVPANFDFSGKELLTAMTQGATLALQGDSAVLYCQSDILSTGKVERAQCYDKLGNESLVSQAEAGLSQLQFSPAQVDGVKVPVRMSYRVGFVNNAASQASATQASTIDVVLIPNLGSMQAQYGRDYSAPQERLDVADWYQRYSENSWVNGQVFLAKGPISRVAATITENGEADIVRALDADRAHKRDVNVVKNAVKRSRFIPGFVDGRPVPMGYLAVINYSESGEAVSAR